MRGHPANNDNIEDFQSLSSITTKPRQQMPHDSPPGFGLLPAIIVACARSMPA